VLINLLGTTAAEDSDEDAEHVTGVVCSSADDELGLGWVLGIAIADSDGDSSGVPAAKQKIED